MLKKIFVCVTFFSALGLAQASFAEDECTSDDGCKDGKVCILAVTPHVCKSPQATGAACKRDVVCASKKCEIPAGKEVGSCK